MGTGMQVEIERKYDVVGQLALPKLSGVAGVSRVHYRPPVALEAVYFDTADRALAANRVTLRRRTGGPDEGWHVKIASGEHRLELHEPLGKADRAGARPDQVKVPRRILDLVQVHVRGRRLRPVAQLNTLRAVVDLLDAKGRPMAELADDQVAAMAVGRRAESRIQHWREWELEIVDAELLDTALAPQEVAAGVETTEEISGQGDGEDPDRPARDPQDAVTGTVRFLDAVGGVLEAAGAEPSPAGSKVEKVVGRLDDPLDPAAVEEPTILQDVLTRTVRTQVKMLKGWDPLVRRDVEDAIHQFRVVSRTLRSILQTYEPLLETEATARVSDGLKQLGRLLSTARDAEVVRDQVQEKVDALPGGPEGPVAALVSARTVKRLRRAKQEEFQAAHDELLEQMRGAEYFAVLDVIDEYARQVPLAAGTDSSGEVGEAGETTETGNAAGALAALEPLAVQQVESVLELARTAEQEQDPEQRIELMHEVRKEAKRLRYAVTAVRDAAGLEWGTELVERMKAAKKLQEALGIHRDSIMFQEHVLTTARRAEKRGEDTFGYGILYAAELPVQAKQEKKAEKLLARLAGTSEA